MANMNAIITVAGRNILIENIAFERPTEFHIAKIGDGKSTISDLHEITELVNPLFDAQVGGKQLIKDQSASACRVPVQITNEGLTATLVIREVGIYTKNASGNDILFAYAYTTEADDSLNSLSPPPMNVSDFNQVRIIDVHFYLTDAEYENINVSISASALVTWGDVVSYAAPIVHSHDTHEIENDLDKEGNIVTLDKGQKAQWDSINQLETRVDLMSNEAEQVAIDAREPLKWKIINHRGYYDKNEKIFTA